MSLVRSEGAFRTLQAGSNLNLADVTPALPAAYTPLLTPGATQIDVLTLTPTLMQSWSLLSVAFQAYLLLQTPSPLYGRLGKLIAGLILNTGFQTATGGAPYVLSLLPLPSDSSLITTLWDGSQDPPPPSQSAAILQQPITNLEVVGGSVTLPEPKDIPGGGSVSLSVGLWLTQSLVATPLSSAPPFGIHVVNASWSVSFDNGLGPAGPQP